MGTDQRRHRAFISYSRVGSDIAAALHEGLEQLAKPARRRRIFDVFLDVGDIPAGGTLPDRLEQGLQESEYLIVVVSPATAGSEWVDAEIDRWIELRGTDHIILALAVGELAWDGAVGAARSGWAEGAASVLPPALRDAFLEEPVWVDFRSEVSRSRGASPGASTALALDDPAFKLNVARLQAPLRGPDVKPSDIVGEDLELFRAAQRRRRRSIIALAALTVASLVGGAIAVLYARRSARQERVALSKQLAGQSSATSGVPLDLGLLLSIEAYRVAPTPEALGSLIGAGVRADDVVRLLHGHDRPLRSLAMPPDGSLMASAAVGGAVILWDPAMFEPSR